VQFAGDASFVAVEDFSGAGFPRTGTLSIWFRWSSMKIDDQTAVLGSYDVTADHVFLRHPNGASVGRFQVAFQAKNTADYVFESDFSIVPAQWSHVVFTWDEAGKQGASYVDGKPVLQQAYSMPFAPTGERFHLGAFLVGEIDEVRLYDRALDAVEATALP
jgi:hypothetical protein